MTIEDPGNTKKRKLPSWVIPLLIWILLINIVCCFVFVVIPGIFYFMPASWWCAITSNTLEGCPLP